MILGLFLTVMIILFCLVGAVFAGVVFNTDFNKAFEGSTYIFRRGRGGNTQGSPL